MPPSVATPVVPPPPPGFVTRRVLAVGPAFVVTVVTRDGTMCAAKRPAPRLVRDPSAARMLEREARALAVLDGASAPRLVEAGEDAHGPYVVTAFRDGAPLANHVHSAHDGASLVAGTLNALAEVHRRGVVHGDLSPANVLVEPAGVVFVDFGLAQIAGEGADGGAFVGTLAYAAPEVARDGAGARTSASDVFAAAVCLLEALTGKGARPRLAAAALLVHVAEVPLDGAALDALVPGLGRALSPDPEHRPTAAELAAAANARARARGSW